ncbi:unnamed protein product [Cuscuta epithymum]|uniref:WRKY domain-containing protein n=1 Tax=Cuscuta epithymum TaxID=186058 RepID=A0AAV0E0P8_9ASTE|nr:unnamed protein product [Cuscuta epithymum]
MLLSLQYLHFPQQSIGMENLGVDGEMKKLISELSHGRDAAAQLQMILNGPAPPPTRSDQEACELLVQNVLSSYEKVLTMLNSESSTANTTRAAVPPSPAGATFGIQSSSSLSGSPHSEDSDRDGDGSRKRKAPRWTQKIKVCKGSEPEGHVDDGYSWRKYGQKEIHGSRYPRAYFRCAHRHTQGCLATKHVQRSDEDPNIFDITFRGKHACKQFQPGNSSPPPLPPLLIPPQNQEPIISAMESQLVINPFTKQAQRLSGDVLKVETGNLNNAHQENNLLFNYFDLSSLSSNPKNDHYSFQPYDQNFGWNVPSGGFGLIDGGGSQNVELKSELAASSEASRITPPPSRAVQTTNLSFVDQGFPFVTMGFDSNFTFGDHDDFFP